MLRSGRGDENLVVVDDRRADGLLAVFGQTESLGFMSNSQASAGSALTRAPNIALADDRHRPHRRIPNRRR